MRKSLTKDILREKTKKNLLRLKRHGRIKRKITGTSEVPRLVVFRSLRHVYAQLVDDVKGKTLTGTGSLSPEIKDKLKGMKKAEKAFIVGEHLAEKAKKKKIERAAFDRAGYRYHGRV